MMFSTWLRNWKRSLENRSSRKQSRRCRLPVRRVALRPRLEALEDRTLLSAYVVTTTADSGPGSLRDAINQINADTGHALYASPTNPNVDEIDFNITAASDAAGGGTGYNATTGVATIQPQSILPALTNSVLLNGYTQAGASQNTLAVGDNAVLKIDLDGSQAGLVNGLNIGSNSTVEGLAVTNFGNGQTGSTAPDAISAGGNNQIIGDFIGTDVTGTVAEGNGAGVYMSGTGNTLGGTDPAMRNVIGGNAKFGVFLVDDNVVEGNYIGTDHSGTKALGNSTGVVYWGSNITIGGSAQGAGNVISGNVGDGIDNYGSGATTGDVIQGNFIGTDATGKRGLGNALTGPTGYLVGDGINISAGASATVVGNVIAANPYGLVFSGTGSGMVVQGNLIGTDATGKTTTGTDGKSLGNIYAGIGGNGPVLIGSPTDADPDTIAADRNIISGNATGISAASGDVIHGNYIGTDITGTYALGNDGGGGGNPSEVGDNGGIVLSGGVVTVVGNLISGNGAGIDIMGGDGSGSVIQGNLIGTDYTGTQPLGNAAGIDFQYGFNYTIGGSTPGAGNVISGNVTGIFMYSNVPVQTGNVIEGNFIGTNAAGATNLGNGTGVYLTGYFSGTEIGGTTAAAANVIANNLGEGIEFNGGTGNVIQGNSIIGNGGDGIALVSSFNNMVGGTTSGAGNTIASNAGNGVSMVYGTGDTIHGSGNSILGSTIHDNGGLGIYLESGTNDNQTAPVLTTATSSATSTTVSGTLASVANTTFRIEFFSNHGLDASSNAEGQTYLGFTTVTTDSNGNASFTATNLAAIPAGQGYLTSTATNLSTGDTSQFSNYLTAPTSTVLTSSANPSLLNQAVTFTATVSSSFGTPTGSVDFVDTTTNTDLGTVALSASGTASVMVSNLAVGSHVITATYAGQGFFLGSSSTPLTQQVSYKFSGFLPPLSNGLAFAVNRSIPIKFTLSDFNGNAISNLSAVSALQIFNSQGVDVLGGNGLSGLSVTGGQYSSKWQTKGLPAGSYTISVTLADGTPHTLTITLTASGNSAGLVTDGSGGSATAGALLGGEVDLYVDNSNGDLTSDELNRIQDAVNSVDATIAPYGVVINEVTDPTQANVTMNMDTTSALGGSSQGVLGCTTNANQVTMIQGWSWYPGADPTQIGSGQYDFETAVVHELGHVLGLGHSSDSTSVMYASLATGTANRALVSADLNVPDTDGGSCALHAAPAVAASSPSVPNNVGSSSGMNPLFAELAGFMSFARNAYQSELSALSALWQQADAWALQRLDALWSVEADAMGVTKRMP